MQPVKGKVPPVTSIFYVLSGAAVFVQDSPIKDIYNLIETLSWLNTVIDINIYFINQTIHFHPENDRQMNQ